MPNDNLAAAKTELTTPRAANGNAASKPKIHRLPHLLQPAAPEVSPHAPKRAGDAGFTLGLIALIVLVNAMLLWAVDKATHLRAPEAAAPVAAAAPAETVAPAPAAQAPLAAPTPPAIDERALLQQLRDTKEDRPNTVVKAEQGSTPARRSAVSEEDRRKALLAIISQH